MTIHFRNAKYLSACEVERADAHAMHYEQIAQHPSEIGLLGPDDVLIVDFNFIHFGDIDLAVQVITEAVRNGVPVGIHCYTISPALRELLMEPMVVVAKTHRRVRAKLRRRMASLVPVSSHVPVLQAAAPTRIRFPEEYWAEVPPPDSDYSTSTSEVFWGEAPSADVCSPSVVFTRPVRA